MASDRGCIHGAIDSSRIGNFAVEFPNPLLNWLKKQKQKSTTTKKNNQKLIPLSFITIERNFEGDLERSIWHHEQTDHSALLSKSMVGGQRDCKSEVLLINKVHRSQSALMH